MEKNQLQMNSLSYFIRIIYNIIMKLSKILFYLQKKFLGNSPTKVEL